MRAVKTKTPLSLHKGVISEAQTDGYCGPVRSLLAPPAQRGSL